MCIRDRPSALNVTGSGDAKIRASTMAFNSDMTTGLTHAKLSLIHISEPTRPY